MAAHDLTEHNADLIRKPFAPCSVTSRMDQDENIKPLDVEPLFLRFLRTLKELLKFVLFSYTVIFGALLLARWTTYFIVGK
ncbi:hypothetical protein CHARACLAT_027256 [Characodon lateralis]|uniref:Uncharacterized protein n=1 Tax=Characodon lateralis TaxID=208331 RepID=A0ABU7DCS0_9TELE|nr:hypothetical protein [Characodon lateralis]